jgi:hypothetical protein
MDHHIYRCFTPQDAAKSGEQHADGIRGPTRAELQRFSAQAKGRVIVGEWSAGLSPRSMGADRGANAGEKDRQRRVFVQAQREVYIKACGGQFFWTYEKGNGWDAGWSVRDATVAAIVPEWAGGRKRASPRSLSDQERVENQEKALGKHSCSSVHEDKRGS